MEEIKRLIAEGKLEEAATLTINLCPSDAAYIISGQIEQFETNLRLGLVDDGDIDQSTVKYATRLLDLIDPE